MENRHALLIINPVSGTRSKAGLEEKAALRLSAAGISLATRYTEGPGHASELAAEGVANGAGIIVSAGGDGTVNEIASAVSHTDVALGIIPLGSGNGLARSLSIPQDTDAALDVICGGNVIRCDRGLVGEQPFYCTFGIGFDAAVSSQFASAKRRGRTSYVKNVVSEFLKYRAQPYAISIGGEVITERAFLIAVCNAPQYGNNAYIAPQAKLDDGLLDLVVVHDGSPLSSVKLGVDMMTGLLDRNKRISSFRVSSATIARLDDGPVHFDGEPLMMGRTLEISCDASSLNVTAPLQREFKPIVSPFRSMISDFRYDVKNQAQEILGNQ